MDGSPLPAGADVAIASTMQDPNPAKVFDHPLRVRVLVRTTMPTAKGEKIRTVNWGTAGPGFGHWTMDKQYALPGDPGVADRRDAQLLKMAPVTPDAERLGLSIRVSAGGHTIEFQNVALSPRAAADAKADDVNGKAGDAAEAEARVVALEHDAVTITGDLYRLVAAEDYDRAAPLVVPERFPQGKLEKMLELLKLDGVAPERASAGRENVAVITSVIPPRDPARGRSGRWGVALRARPAAEVRPGQPGWRIRDFDFLPDDAAVERYLAGFRKANPDTEDAAVAK
jgi:hypothetical protein